MTAAETLRAALDDVPPLRVEKDHYGDWRLWDDENQDMLMVNIDPDIARLIGLLLAAAPHLADLLDSLEARARYEDTHPHDATIYASLSRKVATAISEAGGSR